MRLPCTNRIADKLEKYTTSGDFCRLFSEEMSSLYLLSLLLTGDHELAQQCFVGGLEDSVSGNPVFREWARTWARRMIVENAIRMIAPRPNYAGTYSADLRENEELQTVPDGEAAIARVLELADFERFVFVMSVLERYPDQDCSVLLGCSLHDLTDARTRAFQQIAKLYPQSVDTLAALIQSSTAAAATG